MADFSILAQEVNTDPLGIGYAGMTNQEIADAMNTPIRTAPRISTVDDVRQFLITQINGEAADMRSVIPMICEFAREGTVRGAVPSIPAIEARQSAARMIMFMLERDDSDAGFPVMDENIQLQFVSLGPDNGNGPGIFTPTQLQSLVDLASDTVSRGVEIGWGHVTAGQVGRVRL